MKVRTRISCGEKSSEGACSEREHVSPGHPSWTSISLTQVASKGRSGVPSCCLKAKGVDTNSEASHFANNISRKIKKHVSGKPIKRMGNQSSLCR